MSGPVRRWRMPMRRAKYAHSASRISPRSRYRRSWLQRMSCLSSWRQVPSLPSAARAQKLPQSPQHPPRGLVSAGAWRQEASGGACIRAPGKKIWQDACPNSSSLARADGHFRHPQLDESCPYCRECRYIRFLAFHLRDGRDSSARWKEALLPPKPDEPPCLSHDASRLRRSEIASGLAGKPAKEHWTCIPEGHASADRHAKKMPAPHERRRHQTMDYERSSTP